ncbi:MAG TPA: CoA transferase, partial [Pseudomonadales bacterium]|nr:CoA transferase [Pseudomonadales bacterium]
MGIYRGLTVLEVAGDIPGAVAGLACADRGAEVILVEPPAGNALRHVDAYAEGESKIFQALHRGKKSVVLDPVTNARTLSALIGDADIVIASATEHSPVFDIDYELARALNPEVIYVEATAFGQDGPWAGRHANDLVMQAFGGTMMTEGKKRTDGVTPSVIQSTRYAGFGTGLMLNIAISSALLHRARTGQGQKVETSLLHNLLALQGGRASDNDLADKRSRPARQKMLEARRQGASLKDITRPVPVIINPFYRAYQTRDGAIFVGALTRGLRDKARIALDTDLMARDDPNWDPYDPAQLAEAAEEQRAIEHHVKQKSTAEWLAILEAAGVPTGEVVFPEDLAQTRHLYDNDYLVEVTHDTAGKTLQVAPPVRYGRFPAPEFK